MTRDSTKPVLLLVVLVAAGLLTIFPQGTSTAADTHTITVRYDVATEGPSKGCITSITVDRWSERIHCDHHVKWCNGDSASPPEVIWRVDPATDKYSWEITHKPVSQRASTERDHFPARFGFVDKITQPAGGNLPAILDKGDFPWTYTVSALPAEGTDCTRVDEDPEVVFKGGGGYKPTLLWGAVALTLLVLAWFFWRRRRATAGHE